MNQTHLHIPTPGNHYSASTGSAIMTIIYELACRHAINGGKTQIMVSKGTRHDYSMGECIEVENRLLPTRTQKIFDTGMGWLGLSRKFATEVYQPYWKTIDKSFDGAILLHNNTSVLSQFRHQTKSAQLCSYLSNVVYRTHSAREVRDSVSQADRIVCVSNFLAEDISRRLGQNTGKIVTVHNGVNLEQFYPPKEEREAEIPTILFVGRMQAIKGPDLLLRAARNIYGTKRRFRIRLVGSQDFCATDPMTPYEYLLRELAVPLGAAVTFQPFVDRTHIASEYRNADIFCVPSNWDEPFGMTILEGMASGLPVITSRRGGIPEFGGNAVLYCGRPDVDTLAEQLAYLIDDVSARQEWGRRARRQAEHFSWQQQYHILLRTLCESTR